MNKYEKFNEWEWEREDCWNDRMCLMIEDMNSGDWICDLYRLFRGYRWLLYIYIFYFYYY